MVSFEGYDPSDAKKKVGSFWSYLYPKKEDLDWIKNSVGEIVDSVNIDSFMPKMDDSAARSLLARLQEEQGYVNANKKSWQDYFSTLDDNQKWQIDFVQNTDLQKASLDDVKVAQGKGRQAAIAHNAALKQQTLGAKVATIGMNTLKAAMNAVWWMAIIQLVTSAISWVSDFAKAGEKAKEAAAELSSELQSQKQTIEGNISTVEGLDEEFKRLSKGVDDYGANISLSTDEYKRYQEIVQEIVGISPSLISGYDKEGNAIANKNGLIEQSIALLKEENRQRIENATSEETIGTLGKGEVEKYKDKEQEVQNKRYENSFWVSGSWVQAEKKNEKLLELIGINDKKPSWSNDSSFYGDKLRDNYDVLFQNFDKIIAYNDELKKTGQPTLLSDDEIKRLQNWAKVYGETEAELERASKTLNPTLQMVPQMLTVYDELSNEQKDFIAEYINTFRISADTTEKDIEKMRQDILNFTEAIGNATPETKKAIEDLFSLDKTEMPAAEWEKQVNDLINQIVDTLTFDSEEEKNAFVKQIKIGLGFEFTTDGETSVDTMLEGVKNKVEDEFDDKVGTLTFDELQIAYNIISELPEGELLTWDELKNKIDETAQSVDGIAVSLSELEKTSDNIKALASAFKELSDDGYITTKTLGEIKKATGLADDEWEEYETRLLSAKKGSSDFNQIMSDLTYKILDATFKKEGLVDATEDEIAAVLRENGVSNASAVAHDYLARTISSEEKAKAENSIRTRLLSGDIAGLIENLSSEATACGLTETAFKNLAIQMVLTNETNMSFDDQIANLKALGVAAEITAAKMAGVNGYKNTKYSEKRNARGNMDTRGGLITSVGQETINGSTYIVYYGENGQIVDKEKIGADYDNLTTPIIPQYSSSTSKKSSDDNDKELEALKANLEARKQVIERYKEFVELTDFGIDLAEEDDFGLKSELLSGKISQLTSYGEAMREEFDRIANTIPETGDQADALASRLQELGSNMRSNITEIRETQMELRKLSIDMASALIEDRMEELNSQLDDIDRQIDILNSDYKNDYSHVSNMLSMNMLLPSYSDFGGLRSKNSNANRELIRSEQETQDTINDIIETQIKKNEDLRESERQAILADMATMRNEVQIHLNDVNEDYVSSWRTSQNITDSGVMGIENAINNMDMKIPEPDISNVVKACELVKEMLDNMGDAEYTPPKIKVSDGIDGGDDSKDIISGNKANIVSNIAKNQLGVPYVWGGVAPGIGLDCSGLTQYAYRVAGVSLPRRSQEQWSCGIGKRIDWADLKKGDQLFFGSGDEATHTGIYVGNGQMIHAPHTGDVVKYSSINTEYYQGRFLGAKRYAAGTPKGNALAKDLGIAGENYKPEILIDKATGKATYIDKPTIIDPSKTDVVGEKATARMPKFADGTLDPDTMIDTIEGFYNQVNDEIGKISAKYAKEYVDILHNPKLSDFDKSEKLYGIQYSMGQENSAIGEVIYNQLSDMFYQWLEDVENGTADWSLEIYEAFTSTLDDIIEKSYDMVNTAVESKTAAADMRWDNSNSWISDRNSYNDWELFDDNEVDAWERVVKWLKAEYPNELGKLKEARQNLFNAKKEAAEKSISNIEEYINARNTYNDWDAYGDSEVKAIKRQTYIIEEEYEQRLISYEEYTDKLEEYSQKIYSLGKNQVDKHLSNIDKYTSARNHFNDWDAFGDSETNAIKRQLEILDEAYRLNLISLEEYTEKTDEYTQKLYTAAKNNIVEAISELVEDYEEMRQLESSQLDSQKTLLESYYDVTNAIVEAQHEIDKELRASMSMYEYLDEETRKQLFNQEDYNLLSQELLDIQSAANELQKKYQEDILNADAETIAEITSQYQMQYETMMKQYEIAKAELEVAKKRQQLDNVLAERNTRMFINGQWQWVAKTQDVINAQNELADAEINRKKQEASLEQTEAINKFTTQINSLDTDLNKTRKWWEDMQEMLNGESDEVAKALKEISEVSSPEFKRIIEASGEDVGSFSTLLSESTTTLSTIINGDTGLTTMSTHIGNIITDLRDYSEAIRELTVKIGGSVSNKSSSSSSKSSSGRSDSEIKAQMALNSLNWHSASTQEEKDRLHDANVALGKQLGLDEDDYDSGTGKWKYHADGTRYTPGGLTALGEKDFEAYITNGGRLIPINQPTIGNIGAGGIVFNREQMANLRNLWDLSNLSKISPFVSSSNANSQSTVIDNSIHINGLTVGERGNEDWINGLRRYVATHK